MGGVGSQRRKRRGRGSRECSRMLMLGLESCTSLPEGGGQLSSGSIEGIGGKPLWNLTTKRGKSTTETSWNNPNSNAACNVCSKFAGSQLILRQMGEDLY